MPNKGPTKMHIMLICTLYLFGAFASAGEPRFAKDFQPQQVKFPAGEITLKDAIAELQKQTGNRVSTCTKFT